MTAGRCQETIKTRAAEAGSLDLPMSR